MTKLKAGDKAPYFEGLNQYGATISLNDYTEKKLILFFYPKDNTPGCTAEACNLNENYNEWLNKGYEIVGVSPDSVKSHKKFSDKFNLNYNIIADTDKKILQDFDVWGEKSMYGKKYMGVLRTTFVINKEGIIEEIFDTVNTKEHSDQILKTIKF